MTSNASDCNHCCWCSWLVVHRVDRKKSGVRIAFMDMESATFSPIYYLVWLIYLSKKKRLPHATEENCIHERPEEFQLSFFFSYFL